ncbi:MAG TPA: carboxymuconolactone decarboxylase family protein [Bryobacteraceae bacterium]|nr:carboxymuconolactone decarboxylase family protein [Bryobacteraceae bacterium]
MRLPLLCAGLLALLGLAVAQAPTPADVHLRGGRFAPLTYQQMTPQQKAMIDHLLSGERHSTDGPFNVMLRSPEMGDLAQQLGAYVRFHSELPNKLKEMAILMTGRLWTAQFEWSAHHRAALREGLEPPVIEAIAAGKRPGSMDADEQVIYNFVNELLYKRDVSDRAFHAAVDRFGERRVVNLIGLVGYYQLVSMLLDVDRYPLPEGAKPELQPLP